MKLELSKVTIEVRHQKVVNELSLSLRQGELVGLIGPNGAGKTTLLKAIIGAKKRKSGEISLDGTSLSNLSKIERAKIISYLSQERHIELQLQARAIVMLGRFPHQSAFSQPSMDCERAVDHALDSVNATKFATRNLKSLSGGERALILLARTLAVEAPLMLADEPISELDPYHQIHVMEILKAKAAEGVGILVVLHDLTMAAHFMDRLILINHGSIVAEGSPEKVLTQRNLETVYKISPREKVFSNNPSTFPWKTISEIKY
ncbi:MAG: ABC transporter [Rhodospirillaceae bacterium]|nr:ABC transporter [Rhodospirillaceae bacterium]|tara:strand:+ start:490 stop:1275 length:786 start_codon:yes stop_codon:yes gene_type:complete